MLVVIQLMLVVILIWKPLRRVNNWVPGIITLALLGKRALELFAGCCIWTSEMRLRGFHVDSVDILLHGEHNDLRKEESIRFW